MGSGAIENRAEFLHSSGYTYGKYFIFGKFFFPVRIIGYKKKCGKERVVITSRWTKRRHAISGNGSSILFINGRLLRTISGCAYTNSKVNNVTERLDSLRQKDLNEANQAKFDKKIERIS